jgi:LuxR family transcriptional regulator, maltose regulon positive regulatory protein
MTSERFRHEAPTPGKLTAPGLPAVVIERPRIDALLVELLAEYGAVGVFAVTGSGKTVQAQLFARRVRRPLIWLTLDRLDRSVSRLLSYLAASLEPVAPRTGRILEEGFARGLPFEEVAALLAESVTTGPALVVFDQCEVLADHAPADALLASFLDHLPGGVHTILLGRIQRPGAVGPLFTNRRMGRVSQEDLALTEDESAALARAQGHDPATAVEQCRRARGWMAAVAFAESGRRSRAAGSRDFFAVLGAEIFGALTGAERRFLLSTAILDRISPMAATEFYGPDADGVRRAIQLRHLPATTTAGGTIVLHSCFRDFLLNRLATDEPEHLAHLRRRHADILAAAGEFEEATELLLSVDATGAAARVAEKAVPAVLGRGDRDTVLRWLESLGPDQVSASPVLLEAEGRLTEMTAADPTTTG